MDAVKFSKLGFFDRLKQLGFIRYILIAGLVLFTVAVLEIVVVNREYQCEVDAFGPISAMDQKYENAHRAEFEHNAKLNDEAESRFLHDPERVAVPVWLPVIYVDTSEGGRAYNKFVAPGIAKCRNSLDPLSRLMKKMFAEANPISPAVAHQSSTIDSPPTAGSASTTETQQNVQFYRNLIAAIIVGCAVVFFFVSLGTLFLSTDPKKIDFAQESIKLLAGFAGGLVTNIFH